jgi:hypothetical protein
LKRRKIMKIAKNLFGVIVSICFVFTFVVHAWSAEVPKAQNLIQKAPSMQMIPKSALDTLPKCSVSGTIKLDPNDKTNGYMHYKGAVTFKALANLKGTNLYLNGPVYSCTCITCPSGSSYATGLKPAGTFNANESKTYNVDCASWQQSVSGPQGKGKIEYFVVTNPPAGVFKWSDCSGNFNFTQ